MNFSGQSIVVTGGTQGVGFATAKLFAQQGAKAIAICGRNRENGEAAALSQENNGLWTPVQPVDGDQLK